MYSNIMCVQTLFSPFVIDILVAWGGGGSRTSYIPMLTLKRNQSLFKSEPMIIATWFGCCHSLIPPVHVVVSTHPVSV